MNSKYLLLFILLLVAKETRAQLYMDSFKTTGGDTTIQCLDAVDGYSIYNTSLWVGTNKGLFNYTPSATQIYDTTNSAIPSNDITAVDVENEGVYVWVGTNHGICRGEIFSSSFTCFNTSNSSLPSDSITSILAFGQDSVWIGTRQGLVL